MTALFEDLIFGPIRSRRLGISLGVNLLPQHAKICNFDCIYCECGSNTERKGEPQERRFSNRDDVRTALRQTLINMRNQGELPDVITFAGNGEPTLHPEFEQIIEETIQTRNEIAPEAKISVLSNATTLARESVVRALKRVDNPILKIDSAIESVAQIINRPAPNYSVERVIDQLSSLKGECIVQSMFLRGTVDGVTFDNTTENEVSNWLEAIEKIAPRQVMIYSLDRDTPCQGLQKIEREELQKIAQRVELLGIRCPVA
ncbi:MAG: radical SAM protein [Rikenellaceae bacterium]